MVLAIPSPKNATLSFLYIIKLTLSKTLTPSIVLHRFSTTNKSLPASLSALNPTNGYLLEDGLISSRVNLSNCFFLLVACLAFDALELKRAIKF